MKLRVLVLAGLFIPAFGWAGDGKLILPDFKGLSEKATESVHISLGPFLLHFAKAFIDDSDPDSAAAKRMMSGIKAIEIHSFTFASDFAYSTADIDSVRRQLSAPGWSQLMQVRSKTDENVDMYVLMDDNRASGFALIASEPREFTIINIVGTFNPDDLPRLEKHLHIHQSSVERPRLVM